MVTIKPPWPQWITGAEFSCVKTVFVHRYKIGAISCNAGFDNIVGYISSAIYYILSASCPTKVAPRIRACRVCRSHDAHSPSGCRVAPQVHLPAEYKIGTRVAAVANGL